MTNQSIETPVVTVGSNDKPTVAPSPAQTQSGGGEAIAVEAADGTRMQGQLYAAAGAKRQILIMAIASTDDAAPWQAFARDLASSGVSALVFSSPAYGSGRAASLIDRDLETLVAFIQSRDYPLIYLLGTTAEGTAAIKVATRRDLAGLITVSATRTFMAVDASADVANVTETKLFIASDDDTDAARDINYFRSNSKEPVRTVTFPGSARGSALLTGSNAGGFKAAIQDFVKR